MSQYQSLLGLSSVDSDTINADTVVIQKDLTVFGNSTLSSLILPTNAFTNDVLTCNDLSGSAVWKTPAIPTLIGDTTGLANANQVNTLAGGTIPVSSVVTLSGAQTLTNKTLTLPIISSISNTGTLTLPTSTDTLIGRNTVDTLTNKTLT
nr:hypothetical protein [Candidatus Colwellbacteria bacterium]